MKIQLPLETWMAILDWIRRQELAKKLESHKLWDSQLTSIGQYWLHKWSRNVQIGRLTADKGPGGQARLRNTDFYGKRPRLRKKNGYSGHLVPIADSNLPNNINGFGMLRISYLDSSVLALLHKIRPLFPHLNLDFGRSTNDFLHNVLALLMPLLSDDNVQISSISLHYNQLLFLLDEFPCLLFNAELLNINFLYLSKPLVDWIFTHLGGGRPPVLLLMMTTMNLYNPEYFPIFLEEIQKRFLASTESQRPPFFLSIRENNVELPDEKLIFVNEKTAEQLTVHKLVRGDGVKCVLISKYLLNDEGGEWLAQKEAEVLEWKQPKERQIVLSDPKSESLTG